jgi:hypothetical protein
VVLELDEKDNRIDCVKNEGLLHGVMCEKYIFCTVKHRKAISLGITNKMQCYTIFFIAVEALHVSDGFPPIIRSSNCTHSIWYMSSLLAATAGVGELALVH